MLGHGGHSPTLDRRSYDPTKYQPRLVLATIVESHFAIHPPFEGHVADDVRTRLDVKLRQLRSVKFRISTLLLKGTNEPALGTSLSYMFRTQVVHRKVNCMWGVMLQDAEHEIGTT